MATETPAQRRIRLRKELKTLQARETVVVSALDEYNPQARVDRYMSKPLLTRQWLYLALLALPAFVPFIFMSRPLIEGNSNVLNQEVADVLGTSSALFLFLCLLVTPMVTVTGQRWFVPLRQFYGIMFAFSAILDATTASLVTGPSFAHGPLGRLAGHSFLFVGALMVSIAIPLLITANRRSQRLMGKYWKLTQRATYAIWVLLMIHMALLFGFGPKDPGNSIFHQRFFQVFALGVLLFFWRIPQVRRWAERNRGWKVYAVFVPMAAIAGIFFGFMIIEEVQKGAAAFMLHTIND